MASAGCGKTQWGHWPYPGLFSLEWQCPKCHSALKADVGRHRLGHLSRIAVHLTYLVMQGISIFVWPKSAWVIFVALAACIVLVIPISLWVDSYSLKRLPEEAGQYDLV